MADTYRGARNLALAAQTAANHFVHLTTEAALNQAAGIPVNKPVLVAELTALQERSQKAMAESIAVAMGS